MRKSKVNRWLGVKIFLVVVTFVYTPAYAQNWDEWFKQRRTQRRYLLTQIAELKVYTKLLEKGYGIVKDGLNIIHDIKNGEFKLHQLFFTSLKNINPAVLKYAEVSQIVVLQISIFKRYKKVWSEIQSSNLFTGNELLLFHETFTALIEDVTHTLDELIRITSANKLEMSDDERIRRIDILRTNVMEHSTSLETLITDIGELGRGRAVSQGEIDWLRRLHAD